MGTILNKTRFDDVDSDVGYAYRGFNYVIAVGERRFKVRVYDDEPTRATVISPTDAQRSREARELADCVTGQLGATRIDFYHGPTGTYEPVDLGTLEFGPG